MTCTTKALREARELAEQWGLKVLDTYPKKRHYHLLLENQFGSRMEHPISMGDGERHGRCQFWNMRASFRRFARGQTHGLRCHETH